MPGAVSGIVKFVDRNRGVILTTQGEIEFTNMSDSMKIDDLRERYRMNDRVALFVDYRADINKCYAHTVSPEYDLINCQCHCRIR